MPRAAAQTSQLAVNRVAATLQVSPCARSDKSAPGHQISVCGWNEGQMEVSTLQADKSDSKGTPQATSQPMGEERQVSSLNSKEGVWGHVE